MEAESETLHTAYIAVGANLGDRLAGCRQGVDLLEQVDGIRVLQHSRYYYTAPMEYEDQPWFVNAVFSVKTGLEPDSLLACLKKTETEAGRPEDQIRFGPRVLDLDLIFYDNEVIQTRDLVVPHPRMHKRAFVLRPLCDIAADFVHPVLKVRMADLLGNTEISGQQCFPVKEGSFDQTASA